MANFTSGYFYEKGISVKKDTNESLYWYRQSAELGSVEAMAKLGKLLARKASEFGNRESLFNLGVMYAQGMGEQNREIAFEYFTQAANQKLIQAISVLGNYYISQLEGVPYDENKAQTYSSLGVRNRRVVYTSVLK